MPPAFSASPPFHTLVSRNATTTTNATANATNVALQVICAWPVSGQYGPGSRVLYYVLVAACVFARKTEWLRNACLAAALLFPAVAAIHGIVLAAVNIEGAVDMDVYGAFQLCSIGILAAPVTVKVSRTYFYDPGRNAIFVWTGLLLGGLLSLTVQFYRISTSSCTHDELGNPISLAASQFNYNTTCGLICSVEEGPHSPIRGGSASDIHVIPAPDKLTFGTATLLAAACCIPAVLSLVSMWNKILEINWKTRFGNREVPDELIEGTNGATPKGMDRVNGLVKQFLNVVELPVFGAAVLAILIIGERNFFSSQVRYQTEPIASIGQWAPIAGTGLAVLGSLYILLAKDLEEIKKGETPEPPGNHSDGSGSPRSSHSGASLVPSINPSPEMDEIRPDTLRGLAITTTNSQPKYDRRITISPSRYPSSRGCDNQPPKSPIRSVTEGGNQLTRSTTVVTVDVGNRRRVASMMKKFSNLGSAAQDRFDDSEFKHGPALDFPQIPGEAFRNKNLPQIMKQYNQPRDTDDYTVRPSRAGSFTGSIASGFYSPAPSRGVSPNPRSPSPSPKSRSNTLPAQRPSDPSSSLQRGRPRPRGNTLQVPPITHHNPPSSPTMPEDQGSPTIVVSQDFATPFRPPDASHLSRTRTAGTDENDPH